MRAQSSSTTVLGGRAGGRRPARIGVLVEARYLRQAQPAGVTAALRARGHHVTLIDPASAAIDLANPAWCDGFDLLVCRGRSAAVLALLAMAEASGVHCVNRAAAVSGVLNKAQLGATLATAGIAGPETFLGSPRELADHPDARPPLILKPICGDNAQGLRIVWSRPQLLALHWPDGVALAQRFLATDGTDLKLYVAGDRVWAVRRPSPIDVTDGSPVRRSSAATPVPVTPYLAELADRCRAVTGLELFGVDCAVGPDGPLVLEVNDFPNYTGVTDVDSGLADHVLGQLKR